MKRRAIVLLALVGFSCSHHPPPAEGGGKGCYHWQPATRAQGWAVLLPGAGGLKVLHDETHYFDMAARLNRQGWSVLLVDYPAAYRASGKKSAGSAGEKIAEVAEQAVVWLKQENPGVRSLPGLLIAWSLGAEGVIELLNGDGKSASLGVQGAILYYPSNRQRRVLDNDIPVLILSGGADDVSLAEDVKLLAQGRQPSAAEVELHLYPEAVHGFDVVSLKERKTIRLLPLVGPKATLQYNEVAAQDAESRQGEFLARLTNGAAGTQ